MQQLLQSLPKSQNCIIKKMRPQYCIVTNNCNKILPQLQSLSKPQNCFVICGCEAQFKTFTYICFLIILPLAAAQDDEPDGFADSTTDSTGFDQFSPSLAVIIFVLVAALLLMGFFSIYLRHCTNSTSEIVGTHASIDNRSRKAARGLDKAVIEMFPILEYSEVKIHKIGKEALECAVCLCEFEDTETLRLIPKCDHVFHPECIDEWLSSHTTCPVCRANLVPQPGESIHALPIQNPESYHDIEAQNDAVIETVPEQQNMDEDADRVITDPETETETTLNRNRTVHTRGSRSNRPRKFPRSHSTGHSLVQPGENLERFTLRLPLEVRKRIINRQLKKASSFIVLPRESSSVQGYRTDGEGSSRGKISRLLDLSFKSDRWVFTMAPPFLVRASSPKGGGNSNSSAERTSSSAHRTTPSAVDSPRPPV